MTTTIRIRGSITSRTAGLTEVTVIRTAGIEEDQGMTTTRITDHITSRTTGLTEVTAVSTTLSTDGNHLTIGHLIERIGSGKTGGMASIVMDQWENGEGCLVKMTAQILVK